MFGQQGILQKNKIKLTSCCLATLAPFIRNTWNKDLIGKPTDADRFDEEDLFKRQLSYGASGFNLQFMLDTSISDEDKYPL